MADNLQEHLEHYAHGRERGRLADGHGLLERDRTQLLVSRVLPPPPAVVYDVGGAAGVHARWLADLGYRVTLFDRYRLHVEQAAAEGARQPPFTAVRADARSLPAADGSADVVLLLGPLYHLTEHADRLAALAEARRVLRPGGVLAAAAINRQASLLDGVFRGLLDEPAYVDVVHGALATGHHEPPRDTDWFTRAYFHRPEELRAEVVAAGFSEIDVVGVEGPAYWRSDLTSRRADPARWGWVLDVAERCERDPATIGLSAHLLALARR